MKKAKLLILTATIPCALSLSGCRLRNLIINNNDDMVVDLPTIEVVSSLKINLQGKKEKTLFPTLSNNSIKNPQFDYSSSNESVASVSSEGKVTGKSTGVSDITITLTANPTIKTTVKVSVVDETIEHLDYTIMFYMCASDLEYNPSLKPEERYPFFTEDIKEILSVQNIPDTVKIIIQTGGTTKWSMPSQYLDGATSISSSVLQRWEVCDNKLKHIEDLSTNHMASENTFSEFLSWGLDDYEADQMGVVISGHGGGIAGCAYDDNYTVKVGTVYWTRSLRTFEVAHAADKALKNSNRNKFTWIGYDACIMQCADIASINADYFDYMVASQENESAIGWNHDVYLPTLVENPTIEPEVFLRKICSSFMLQLHTDEEVKPCYQTLSVLDLSKADALVTAFNNFCEELGTVRESYKIAKNAFDLSLNTFGDKIFGLCDFSSLMSNFISLDTTAVIAAIDDMVLDDPEACSKYDDIYHVKPCGLNAFFPEKATTEDEDKYVLQVGREDYAHADSTKFTLWKNMCVSYGNFGWISI